MTCHKIPYIDTQHQTSLHCNMPYLTSPLHTPPHMKMQACHEVGASLTSPSHHITSQNITEHHIKFHHNKAQHITAHHSTAHHISNYTSDHVTSHHIASHPITPPHITYLITSHRFTSDIRSDEKDQKSSNPIWLHVILHHIWPDLNRWNLILLHQIWTHIS